jgi:hypothetical protein
VIVVSGGTHSLKSATGGCAMKSYELSIDLEALKTSARPLPGTTDTQRNWSAVREQMHGCDRSAAPADERDGRTTNLCICNDCNESLFRGAPLAAILVGLARFASHKATSAGGLMFHFILAAASMGVAAALAPA